MNPSVEQSTTIEIHDNQNKTWYNLAEGFDKWRVFPRLLISLYGYAFYRTTEWFMAIPADEVSNAQAGFVSVIVGAGAGFFGIYVNGKNSSSSSAGSNSERL